MQPYRPTLAVHVVWHPACAEAAAYARSLFGHVFEDPRSLASHGLRIPVRLWRSTPDPDPPPPPVPPLDDAAQSAVVVLIDDTFIVAPGCAGLPGRMSRPPCARRTTFSS